MNSRRAAVSCRFSQEVGKGLGREGGKMGGGMWGVEVGRENRGGGGGSESGFDSLVLIHKFLFLSTVDKKEWKF